MRHANLFRAIAVLSSAFACTSCAQKRVDLELAMQSYAQAKSCCSSLSELPIASTLTEGETIFSISQADNAFDFGDNGLSYFKAFELPALDRPLRITIESDLLVSEKGAPGTMFYPVISLLDENKHIVSETPQDHFDLIRAEQFGSRDLHEQNTMEIPPSDRPRYVIVHTTRYLLAHGFPIRIIANPQMIGAGGLFLLVGGGPAEWNYYPSPITAPDTLRLLVEIDTKDNAAP